MTRILTIDQAHALMKADRRAPDEKAARPLTLRSLRVQLEDALADAGDEGLELGDLRSHVVRHGAEAVATELRALGVRHEAGRVRRRRTPHAAVDRWQRARPAAAGGARESDTDVTKAEVTPPDAAPVARHPTGWHPVRFVFPAALDR